jgi:hypothetical protein
MPSTYTHTCNGRAGKDMILCRVIVAPGTGGSQEIVTEKFVTVVLRSLAPHHHREVAGVNSGFSNALILITPVARRWFLAPPESNLSVPGYTIS